MLVTRKGSGMRFKPPDRILARSSVSPPDARVPLMRNTAATKLK